MLAFTTKSISRLIISSFLMFELEVEFNKKKKKSPRLLRGELMLAEEVTDDIVVKFHYEW